MLICRVGSRLLGVRLESVERVEGAVEISPLPEAPAGVCGVINVHGRPVPVLDPRPALGFEARGEPELSDHLVLLRLQTERGVRSAALLVDETLDVAPVSGASGSRPSGELVAGMHEEDRIVVVGEQLVLVRGDGALMPPVLLDLADSLDAAPSGMEPGPPR